MSKLQTLWHAIWTMNCITHYGDEWQEQGLGRMKPQSRREPSGPVLDETAFQQLLSAAYVMQEHNSRLKKTPLPTKPSTTAPSGATPAKATVIDSPPAHETKQTASTCQECGSKLARNEFFCENCGAPAERPNNTTQKNWASLWEMHQSSQTVTKPDPEEFELPFSTAKTVPQEETAEEEIDLFPAELEEIVGKFAEPGEEAAAAPETSVKALTVAAQSPAVVSESAPAATWSSAAKARAWLDSLKSPQKSKDWFRDEWTFHRGVISIALASAVLLAVLFQWVTRPAPVSGQSRGLSAFEQMLVSVGLAEAPPPISPTPQPGNPHTKVWVDVHTALYYCPGADLYGKTPDGKYTSQLEAQRDNFQPSTLKACD